MNYLYSCAITTLLLVSQNVTAADVLTMSPKELEVSKDLPFEQQVAKHAEILDKLAKLVSQAETNLSDADKRNSLPDYKAALADRDNTYRALAPYAVAQGQANELIAKKYLLNDLSGKACIDEMNCMNIEPITAVFFFTENGKGLPKKSDAKTNTTAKTGEVDLTALYRILSGKPLDLITFGALPAVRDFIIPPDDNGEIAKLIRDPGRRAADIVEDFRNKIISPKDNGEGAKIIRDPIKCTVGRLWKAC